MSSAWPDRAQEKESRGKIVAWCIGRGFPNRWLACWSGATGRIRPALTPDLRHPCEIHIRDRHPSFLKKRHRERGRPWVECRLMYYWSFWVWLNFWPHSSALQLFRITQAERSIEGVCGWLASAVMGSHALRDRVTSRRVLSALLTT